MPVIWDAENDARLMMAFIETTDVKLGAEGWKAIAEKLGGDATVGAISQRFSKVLKKKYGGANCAIGSGGGSAAATPAKPRGGRKKKGSEDSDKTPRASPRKRTAKAYAEPATRDEGDEEEIPDSPTKKLKQEEEIKSFFDEV